MLYEHSRKTVLIRVHDNAECRLYSHIVSLESLFGVEPSDEEEVHKVDILRISLVCLGYSLGDLLPEQDVPVRGSIQNLPIGNVSI